MKKMRVGIVALLHESNTFLERPTLLRDFEANLLCTGEQVLATILEINGLRIIALDTTIPGYHDGELTPTQLGWLREQLAAARAAERERRTNDGRQADLVQRHHRFGKTGMAIIIDDLSGRVADRRR